MQAKSNLGKKQSLATKFIFYIVLFGVSVTILVSAGLLYRDYNTYNSAVKNQLDEIEKSVSSSLSQSLWDMNEEQIQNQLEGIWKLPDMAYAGVILPDEEKAAYLVGQKLTSGFVLKEIDIMKTGEDGKKSTVGKLVLMASLEGVVKRIKNQVVVILGTQILQSIVVSIIILIFFRGLVSKHLLRMANFAESLDLDKLGDDNLELDRKPVRDELGKVVSAFNNMKGNLKKSHEQLQEYAATLEQKVEERTKEIEVEKAKVSNLLNSMRQAIFSIDANRKVVSPVSAFTSTVFGMNPVGKDIYETLFKDLDRESEEFSMLNTALISIFGEDDLQYELSEENLTNKLVYRKNDDENDGQRIFSISYNPMFDSNGILTNLMFVVEDITELERLQMEMEEEKRVSEKKIQIIREIASNDIEDIEVFLKDAPQMVSDSLILAKSLREGENLQENLGDLFRTLHTLKGNSRSYNFGEISNATHRAENLVKKGTDLISSNQEIEEDLITELNVRLYNINAELQAYSDLANRVFRIENEFEAKILHGAITHMTHLDNLFGKHIEEYERSFYDKNVSIDQRKELYNKLIKNLPDNDTMKKINRSLHSLKGEFRSLNKKEMSEKILRLEIKFANLENERFETFEKEIIPELNDIKQEIKSMYIGLGHSHPYSLKVDTWIGIVISLYEFTKMFQEDILIKNNLKSLFNMKQIIDRVKSDATNLKLYYLETIVSDLEEFLYPDNFETERSSKEINNRLSLCWNYFALVSRLIENMSDDRRADHLKILKELPSDVKKLKAFFEKKKYLKSEGKSLILSTAEKIWHEDGNPYEFFKSIENYFTNKHQSFIEAFIFEDKSGSSQLKMMFKDLKDTQNFYELPEDIKNAIEQKDPIALTLKDLFSTDNGGHNSYRFVKYIDIIQLLRGADSKEDTNVEIAHKAHLMQVVSENYNRLGELIKSGKSIEKIQSAYSKLTDIPVMSSLGKYSNMIKDISSRLDKKVDFKISGEDVTMNRDKFFLVQDAVVHIIRNSLDHGLETAEERKTHGKKDHGLLQIIGREDNGNIMIKISDDGRGIDSERVCQKAIESGLIKEENAKKMTPEERLNLIFIPNLSSKSEVSDLSGRGVGMDIVKTNVEKIGGKIEIASNLGVGTSIILKIPA
ncbi:MAG: Hpt domain-containing protein [Halobacteriovoraceae bacterium]|nr:Hpt domain-containing protein [Halobacteriovoraceae bacterium]